MIDTRLRRLSRYESPLSSIRYCQQSAFIDIYFADADMRYDYEIRVYTVTL